MGMRVARGLVVSSIVVGLLLACGKSDAGSGDAAGAAAGVSSGGGGAGGSGGGVGATGGPGQGGGTGGALGGTQGNAGAGRGGSTDETGGQAQAGAGGDGGSSAGESAGGGQPQGGVDEGGGASATTGGAEDGGAPVTADFPCGRPGEPCCPVEGCLDGGCCSGNPWYRCLPPSQTCGLSADDVCDDGSCGSCGGLGEPCCGASSCTAPRTACQDGECAPCGGAGEPCCRNAACDDGLGCDTAVEPRTCTEVCGETDQPCCGGNTCRGGGCCVEGQCAPPGGECVGYDLGSTTEAGVCQAGACEACGTTGQPCCWGTTLFCTDPGSVCPTDGSNLSPRCSPCGGPSEPCCPGDVCFDGGCCLGVGDALLSICFAEGDTCNNQGGVCESGRCSDCGRPDQRCCSFQRCYESACAAGDCQ